MSTDATPVPLRLEAIVLGVADADRAKAFYEGLGWRLDADFVIDDEHRIIQLTPPGSATSVQFGTGQTEQAPGTTDGLLLVVDDVAAARDDLRARGADVSEIWHGGRTPDGANRQDGPDPDGRSYVTHAEFRDPDGNRWVLQQVTERLPGRE
jgi:catechol 2,3-dioxygenase-like lactoylglutathione lyase family enzyme